MFRLGTLLSVVSACALLSTGCTIEVGGEASSPRHAPPPPHVQGKHHPKGHHANRRPPARRPPVRKAAPPPAKTKHPGKRPTTKPPITKQSQGRLVVVVTGGTCFLTVDATNHGDRNGVTLLLSLGKHTVSCQPKNAALQRQFVNIVSGRPTAISFNVSSKTTKGPAKTPINKKPPIGRPTP